MLIGMGDIVELSNRQTGIVVDVNGNQPARPVVRLFESGVSGSQLSPELDLAKHSDIGITRILPDIDAIDASARGCVR